MDGEGLLEQPTLFAGQRLGKIVRGKKILVARRQSAGGKSREREFEKFSDRGVGRFLGSVPVTKHMGDEVIAQAVAYLRSQLEVRQRSTCMHVPKCLACWIRFLWFLNSCFVC